MGGFQIQHSESVNRLRIVDHLSLFMSFVSAPYDLGLPKRRAGLNSSFESTLFTSVAMCSLFCLLYFLDLTPIGLQFSARFGKSRGRRIEKVVCPHILNQSLFSPDFTQTHSKSYSRMTAAHKSGSINSLKSKYFCLSASTFTWSLRTLRSRSHWHDIMTQ